MRQKRATAVVVAKIETVCGWETRKYVLEYNMGNANISVNFKYKCVWRGEDVFHVGILKQDSARECAWSMFAQCFKRAEHFNL